VSHGRRLVLSLSFALAWLDAWDAERAKTKPAYWPWLATVTAAVSLGMLILTRPLTAVGLVLPFSLHGVYLIVRSSWAVRRRLVVFSLIVLFFSGLRYLWQDAVTGDARLNPYTLWWEYDRVGFGPGYGRKEIGHTLRQARINTEFSLRVGWNDLFGWGRYTWILPLIGLLAALRYRIWRGVLLGSVYPSLVLVYLAYWIGSSLFGPRYYYEGLFSLTLLSGAGIAWMAGWPVQPGSAWRSYSGWRRIQPLLATAALALLVSMSLIFYTPLRVGGMYGLYGISRARLAPFLTPEAQELTPALVVVHPDHWAEYGALLELQTPFLDTPWLFVFSRGPGADSALAADYPERSLLYYYPDEPYKFFLSPRSE